MPIHPDYQSMHDAMIKKYGRKKGRSVFYAYMNAHNLDYTKPREKDLGEELVELLAASIDKYPETAELWLQTEEYFDAIDPIVEADTALDPLEAEDIENDSLATKGLELKSSFGTSAWPDSAFMWVPPEARGANGKKSLRKLPYKNKEGSISLSHVKNALARLNQAQGIPAEAKARIKNRLQALLRRAGGKPSEEKSFQLDEPLQVTTKEFYGAFMPIIAVSVKAVDGEENYFIEGFLSTPLKDLQGETVDLPVLEEWAQECIKPPHNLIWLFHDSPYKSLENKDKPAMVRLTESAITDKETPTGQKVKGLWVKGILNKAHPKFRETWEMVKNGFINALSAEFLPLMVDPLKKLITKGKYLSSSIVMAPANEGATITAAYVKSFIGTEVKMSNNQSASGQPEKNETLEDLLQGLDKTRRLQLGPPVPGVPGVGAQPPAPAPAPPAAAPAAAPASTPAPTPAPAKSPTEEKIDQLMSQFNALTARINTIAPPPPPPRADPKPEDVDWVLEYLKKPRAAPPAPAPAPAANPVPAQAPAAKMYSKEEVEDEVLRRIETAKREGRIGQVVVKGVNPANATMPETGSASLEDIANIGDDNLEGMLNRMDLMRGKSRVMVVE